MHQLFKLNVIFTTTSYASMRAMIPFSRSFSCRVVKCALTLHTKSSTECIFKVIENNITNVLISVFYSTKTTIQTIASIISESVSSEMFFRIADNNKLYLVNRCIGRTKISASLSLNMQL